MTEPILSPGEWESLLLQVPKQVHAFVVKLAVHHGHLKPSAPANCPVCGARAEAPGQLPLMEAAR